MGLHGTQGVELVESVLQGGEKEEGMGREERGGERRRVEKGGGEDGEGGGRGEGRERRGGLGDGKDGKK